MPTHSTYIIANWKMNLDVATSAQAAGELASRLRSVPAGKSVVVCPSFLAFSRVATTLHGSAVGLGAQDCYWEQKGAFTGEVSPADLVQQGCTHVIIGHSERRSHLGETEEQVHRKLEAALASGLTPILCVGENYDARSEGQKDNVLIRQLSSALQGISLDSSAQLIVAYEPVWAISTGPGSVGIEATPEEVTYAGEVIRHVLVDLVGRDRFVTNVRLIYGGSVTAATVGNFTHLPNIAGVLVGSASLKPVDFLAVIAAA